jgi:hypothetical protein
MALVTNSNKSETFNYIPVSCRGDEAPFSVTVKRLDKKSFAKLEDGLTKVSQEDATISFASGSFNWSLVKRGVISWENITDENSAQVKFVKDTNGFMDDISIEALPLEMITEIANLIANITRTPEHTDLFLGKFSPEVVTSVTA